MRSIFWGFAISAIFCCGCSSIDKKQNVLFDAQINGKAYEILSPEDYNTLRASYDYIGDFAYGMAKVRRGERYGLIDEKGNLAIPCKYVSIDDCDTLRNWIKVAIKEKHPYYSFDISKYGFIDMSTGKEVVPCEYFLVKEFSEGLALVEKHDNSYGYIDEKGNIAISFKFKREKTDGLSIIQIPLSNFYEDRAIIIITRENEHYYGYIDKNGEVAIPCIYSKATSFRDGIASVRLDGKNIYIDRNGHQITPPEGYNKWGFINRKGETVIPFQYDWADNFREGFAAISKDGKSGYIDNKGKVLTSIQYDRAEGFKDGIAIIEKDGVAGYLSKYGQLVLTNNCDVIWSFSEGLAAMKIGDKWGFFDTSGRIVIPAIYARVGSFSDGLAYASVFSTQDFQSRYGFLNKRGETVIPFKYGDVRWFSEGLAPVMNGSLTKGGKWGFIDKNDNIVIDFKYESAMPFRDGIAAVEINEEWININRKGEKIVREKQLKYDLNPTQLNGKWGYVDRNNNTVIPFEYESASMFSEGLAHVKKGNKYGYIDAKGNVVIPFQYQFAKEFVGGLAAVEK